MLDAISECILCGSSKLLRLNTEMYLHFTALEELREAIFVRPKALVCSDCGFILCNLSEKELKILGDKASPVSA